MEHSQENSDVPANSINLKKADNRYVSSLKKDIQCVYAILEQKDYLSTKEIVQLALSQKFDELCNGCASADNVIRALRFLQEEGLVLVQLAKGGYCWKLLNC